MTGAFTAYGQSGLFVRPLRPRTDGQITSGPICTPGVGGGFWGERPSPRVLQPRSSQVAGGPVATALPDAATAALHPIATAMTAAAATLTRALFQLRQIGSVTVCQ